MLHREDRKDICLLFPSSSVLRRHQQWAATSLSSIPVQGSHLISANREFRGKCWGDTHHTQGLSQVHSRGIWRGWRGQSSLGLVSSSSDLREWLRAGPDPSYRLSFKDGMCWGIPEIITGIIPGGSTSTSNSSALHQGEATWKGQRGPGQWQCQLSSWLMQIKAG